MNIAVIGSGISGLIAALLLQNKHSVTVFEAESWVGGHVHTIPVQHNNATLMIDTGFIVCNDRNYPNFLRLMQQLNIEPQKTIMSFSVSSADGSFEYNGTDLNGMFSQRKNLFKPKFWRMLADILKFNSAAKAFIRSGDAMLGFDKFLAELNLGKLCKNFYVMPMISAIWSSQINDVPKMPALFLCKFFDNHGLLNINNRPQWFTIPGGSNVYVAKILALLKNQPLTNSRVLAVTRNQDTVNIKLAAGSYNFDKVIIATHSDQALQMLADPSAQEAEILSKIRYQDNSVTLHTDLSILPKNRRTWASWNYRINDEATRDCVVTYNMNILQNLKVDQTYCVSLNQDQFINPNKIIGQYTYAHPIFDCAAINARQGFKQISGVNNTYYCGAYWGSGFHEDGMNSGLKVVEQLDKELFCTTPYTLAV